MNAKIRLSEPEGQLNDKKSLQIKSTSSDIDVIESTEKNLKIDKSLKINNTTSVSEMALEHLGNGIMITDAHNTIQQVNPAFCKISGFQAEHIVGRKPFLLRSGEHDESFYNRIWKVLEQEGFWQGEICYRHRDGSLFYVWESITAVSDSQGVITHYVSAMADMTQLKQQQQALDELANFDALTQLPNRHYFDANLTQTLATCRRQGTRAAVLFIDLDQFKPINDQFGHKAGDLILTEVASRISRVVRTEDTAARIGGDEFVVLMPRVFERGLLESIAHRLLKSLTKPIELTGSVEVTIGASIGVSIYPDDVSSHHGHQRTQLASSETEIDIVELADQAMYTAKENNLPLCFFDQLSQYPPKSRMI